MEVYFLSLQLSLVLNELSKNSQKCEVSQNILASIVVPRYVKNVMSAVICRMVESLISFLKDDIQKPLKRSFKENKNNDFPNVLGARVHSRGDQNAQ